jgi:hypothetical protein
MSWRQKCPHPVPIFVSARRVAPLLLALASLTCLPAAADSLSPPLNIKRAVIGLPISPLGYLPGPLATYIPGGLGLLPRKTERSPSSVPDRAAPAAEDAVPPLSGTWQRILLGILLISIMVRRARPALPR